MTADNFLKALTGIIIAAVQGGVLAWQQIIGFSEPVRVPVVAGSVFGILVGPIIALYTAPDDLKSSAWGRWFIVSIVLAGGVGCMSVYFFYDIVEADREPPARGLILFLLMLLASIAVSYLATVLSIALGKRPPIAMGDTKP